MDYNNRQVQNLYHPDLQQKRSHSHIFRYAKKKKKKWIFKYGWKTKYIHTCQDNLLNKVDTYHKCAKINT